MGADFSLRSPRSFVYSPAYGETMADSNNNILTESPNSQQHWIVLIAFVAPFVFVTLGCWVWNLQTKNDLLQHRNDELHEMIQKPAQLECPMVAVTCACPEYDEGWEDAQHAIGCDPDINEMDLDVLQNICEELDSYGYVPHC